MVNFALKDILDLAPNSKTSFDHHTTFHGIDSSSDEDDSSPVILVSIRRVRT